LAEDPQVEQITFRQPAIRLAVIGPRSQDRDAEMKLREVTESVHDALLDLPEITQATLLGAKAHSARHKTATAATLAKCSANCMTRA
jgi:HAE1 family hydrophobic/amphiphilic exporter-1